MIEQRTRLQSIGIKIGKFPRGAYNAITDVHGVLVGHQTLVRDTPNVVRTGVTVVVPRAGKVHEDPPFAGYFSFNGIGEMTGLPLLDEWGILTSPIALTNTNLVGLVREAITRYGARMHGGFAYKLPVVAETYDGFLSDIDSFPLTEEDVIAALEGAASGPVAEGNVGGGTGMICYDFKGGIGTASRVVTAGGEKFTIGALVQANHGSRHMLRVDGFPVGQVIDVKTVPSPWIEETGVPESTIPLVESSSIIVVIATDAPLLADQCRRLARRATVGLARTGGIGYNSSGDIFLAFATGNHYDPSQRKRIALEMLHQSLLDPFFEATAEAVEEAILNALLAAQTITGYKGRKAYALPIQKLLEIVRGRSEANSYNR